MSSFFNMTACKQGNNRFKMNSKEILELQYRKKAL